MAYSSLGGVTSLLQNVDLRAERFSVVAGQTLLVSTVLVLPLLYTLIPPLEDYPNHLARMFALAKLRESPALAEFYEVNWAMIPDLIMDLLTPPLVPLVGVYTAGRMFLAARPPPHAHRAGGPAPSPARLLVGVASGGWRLRLQWVPVR